MADKMNELSSKKNIGQCKGFEIPFELIAA